MLELGSKVFLIIMVSIYIGDTLSPTNKQENLSLNA